MAKSGLSATIITLLDADWGPVQPNLWINKANLETAATGRSDFYDASIIGEQALAKIAWGKAELHFAGQGLGSGPPSKVLKMPRRSSERTTSPTSSLLSTKSLLGVRPSKPHLEKTRSAIGVAIS